MGSSENGIVLSGESDTDVSDIIECLSHLPALNMVTCSDIDTE